MLVYVPYLRNFLVFNQEPGAYLKLSANYCIAQHACKETQFLKIRILFTTCVKESDY